MLYKFTKEDKLNYLVIPLVSIFLMNTIIPFLFWYYNNWSVGFYFEMMVMFTLPLLIMYYIPLIVLYINYFNKSKYVKLSFDEVNKEYIYDDGKEKVKFNWDDIDKAIFYMYLPKCKNGLIFLAWYDFYYVKIITKKEVIIITCLTCDKMMDMLPSDKITKKCVLLNNMIK